MIYSCNICNFKCNRKVDYNRHLLTKKHNKRINNILPTNHVDDNDKKNKNNFISIDEIYENECSDDSCIKISNQIIMKLLKDNEEMKKIIIEQNKQQTQIMIQQQQQQQQQQ
jgi:ribosomal protein L35